MHQTSEELTFNASVSFSKAHVSQVTTLQSLNPNLASDQQTAAVVLGAQYLLSEKLIATFRYAFFDRISSAIGQSYYQNVALVGVTKQF